MSNPFRRGTWDWWYDGVVDLWVEWKYVQSPPIRTALNLQKNYLSPLQVYWGLEREKHGRNVWVGVGCSQGGFWLTHSSEWMNPINPDSFIKKVVDRKTMADILSKFLLQNELSTTIHNVSSNSSSL